MSWLSENKWAALIVRSDVIVALALVAILMVMIIPKIGRASCRGRV